MVELLAAVAIALTGQPVELACGDLPPAAAEIHAYGAVWPDPARIYLLPWVCRSAYRGDHQGLTVLAHEILHIQPNRTEEWTRSWDDWYAEHAVRQKIRALRDGFAWTVTDRQGSAGQIEQQPGVVYTGACLWTIDSNVELGGYGKLAAGASASYQECLIADGFSHEAGVNLTAATADLIVTISYAPQGRTFQVPARPVADGYEYRGCVIGPGYADWPSLPTVDDSNDGHGLPTDITVTVTNPTSRTVRNVNAFAAVASSRPGLCQQLGGPYEDPAGVVWRTGL